MTDHNPTALNLARLHGATHFRYQDYTGWTSVWYAVLTDGHLRLLVRNDKHEGGPDAALVLNGAVSTYPLQEWKLLP